MSEQTTKTCDGCHTEMAQGEDCGHRRWARKTSSGLSDLELLQLEQAGTRFSNSSVPPADRGTM
jgi:hypothetical protein